MKEVILLLVVCIVSFFHQVDGKPKYRYDIPNGGNVPDWPALGHVRPYEGKSLNPFGNDFKKERFLWTYALCMMDSDGDGYSNGVELDDPFCTWKRGDPDPKPTGRSLTHPGIPDEPLKTSMRTGPSESFRPLKVPRWVKSEAHSATLDSTTSISNINYKKSSAFHKDYSTSDRDGHTIVRNANDVDETQISSNFPTEFDESTSEPTSPPRTRYPSTFPTILPPTNYVPPDEPTSEPVAAPSTSQPSSIPWTHSPSTIEPATDRPTFPPTKRTWPPTQHFPNPPSKVLVAHVLIGAAAVGYLIPLVGLVRSTLPKSVFLTKLHKYLGYMTLACMVSASFFGLLPRFQNWNDQRDWSVHGVMSLTFFGQLLFVSLWKFTGKTHAVLTRLVAPMTVGVIIVSGVMRAEYLKEDYLYSVSLSSVLAFVSLALCTLMGLRWWKLPRANEAVVVPGDIEAPLLPSTQVSENFSDAQQSVDVSAAEPNSFVAPDSDESTSSTLS